MVWGYARCSTSEEQQDINRQTRELIAAGADEVVCEYEHGDAKVKAQLEWLMDSVQSGDTILTAEVSRLSRSVQQFCGIIEQVKDKKLMLKILNSVTIDCRNGVIDPMSQAFLQMAAVFAELELAMIRSRVKSGMENARAKGAQIGRPRVTEENLPQNFWRYYAKYNRGEINVSELARLCDVSRTTVYRYIKAAGGER